MKGAVPMATNKLEEDKKINGFERWDVRCSMDTLAKAHTIKKDKKLMEAIGILAKERMEEMAHVLGHVEKAEDK